MLRRVTSAADLEAAQELCWRYRSHLLTHDGAIPALTETLYPLHDYNALVDRLAEEHAAPDGALLIAYSNDRPVGCGMFRRFDRTSCEIKRVFITPEARGLGSGRTIVIGLLRRARAAGYKTARLDTMKSLRGAGALYLSMGFTEVGPYRAIVPSAQGHLCFFEYDLTA